MLYLIAFIIILIFFIETWNSIKSTTYSKEQFINSTTINNGLLPANIGESSNFILYPKPTNIQELIEKNNSGNFKYAYSNPSSMFFNENYFDPTINKYNTERHKLPTNWMCQRDWFDCNQTDDYFNKFKTK